MARRKSSLLKETEALAEEYNITPQKRFGQNFLISDLVYVNMLEKADLNKDDRVLEVGPGLGFLTMSLAERVKEVVTVEIDKKIASIVPERLALFGYTNARVVEGNILDFPNLPTLENFASQPYKIVANLPYNITSVFLRKFLEGSFKPESLTLMLQKEVAERICAKAGGMNLLALSVQFYAEPRYCFRVDKSDFWPSPEVHSAVIHIKTRPKPVLGEAEAKKFWRLAHIGFSAKRKMLKKNLANALDLEAEDFARILELNGLNPNARPQELGLDEWLKLFAVLKKDVL